MGWDRVSKIKARLHKSNSDKLLIIEHKNTS